MSDVLTPRKSGRGWIIEVPAEMARALDVAEGSIAVLYAREGKLDVEILPPLSPEMAEAVRETYEEFKETFEEMKRLGD